MSQTQVTVIDSLSIPRGRIEWRFGNLSGILPYIILDNGMEGFLDRTTSRLIGFLDRTTFRYRRIIAPDQLTIIQSIFDERLQLENPYSSDMNGKLVLANKEL